MALGRSRSRASTSTSHLDVRVVRAVRRQFQCVVELHVATDLGAKVAEHEALQMGYKHQRWLWKEHRHTTSLSQAARG